MSMLIPRYWAEARSQAQVKGPRSVRRYGWSTTSQADAQAMADTRVAEAVLRVAEGEKVVRIEPKAVYNGADGFPVREEIVAEHGDVVVTRNSYGALCLNTPDALFADVDFPEVRSGCTGSLLLLAVPLILGAAVWIPELRGWLLLLVGLTFLLRLAWKAWERRFRDRLQGRAEVIAMGRIRGFVDHHPDWRLRVYRTPAGYRVLATHRPFQPTDPEVDAFFAALETDPVYAQMCRRQQCFRARVSPKPWRIGVGHLRPRKGVWPIDPEKLPLRREWVAAYEAKSAGHAACRFEVELGRGTPHGKVLEVQRLHDALSRADSGLPIA